MNRGAGLVALLLVALPVMAASQTPGRPSPSRPGEARDSVRADTIVEWYPADSVLQKLLAKPGYTVTRYEGATVTFDALSKALAIAADAAKRAIVERDSQRVVTDSTIVYDDRSNSVNVSGRFNIRLGSGQAPVQGSGTARYDLAQRSGRMTNARVVIEEQGERWFIDSDIGKTALGDSTRRIPQRFYGLGGSLTSCEDSVPDYHFRLKEIKRTEKTLVARPAVLYIRDIPVMWLPFVFQDIRPGRRSGILSPGLGASDIVRNNPGYRRNIENIGYYWAISDYADFATWVNWRSSAGADSIDPGWYEVNGEWKYNWLTRFLSGRLATAYMKERGGDDKLSVSWDHRQRLGPERNFNANVNYTTSPSLQRRNTFLPAQAIATIVSSMAFTDKLGPASLQVGGQQRQYPGRNQVDRTAPTISMNTTPLAVGEWLVWTPGFSFSESATLNIDQPSTFSSRYVSDANGRLIRTDTLERNSFDRTITVASPLRIFGVDLSQNVTIRDQLHDYPEELRVIPDADSSRREWRVFPHYARTTVDWNPSFSLPPIFQNRFKITPSITLSNVDPGPYWVRSSESGGQFVHQKKRLSYGLSAAPTIFGLWPGFGPFQRFRHSVSPGLSYSFAPRAKVGNDYLQATGRDRQTYLGSLPQSMISFSLSQNIEAKVRAPADTLAADGGQKLKVLTTTFTPLSYDFERARATGRKLAGVTTDMFGATMRSDLIPGFDLSMNYSLFEGSTQTDTAVFKPFLTQMSSSMRLSQSENPLTVITRLFGRAVPERSPAPETGRQRPDEAALTRQIASQPVAGQAARGSQFIVPPSQGWQASLSFSTSRSRPIRGDRVIEFDARVRCELLRELNPFAYDECLRQPSLEEPLQPLTNSGPGVRTPRQSSMTGNTSFALTQKWSASWSTSYDFEQSKFASHMVSLQRDLHDWRAIFAFTHSPNGNFAFNFFIALKPQPDLKFDYSRATVRSR